MIVRFRYRSWLLTVVPLDGYYYCHFTRPDGRCWGNGGLAESESAAIKAAQRAIDQLIVALEGDLSERRLVP